MEPGCGSTGVTVVVAGATWLVRVGGRLIQTRRGHCLGAGWPVHEPLGMGGIGGEARAVTGRQDGCGAAVVDVGWASDSSGRCDGARRCTKQTGRG